MSVLIKGYKMPESCNKCPCYWNWGYYHECQVLKKTISLSGRREDCPLIEVPTPHGKLIDAGKIKYHFEANENTAMEGYEFVTKGEIDRVPTVVEKEE